MGICIAALWRKHATPAAQSLSAKSGVSKYTNSETPTGDNQAPGSKTHTSQIRFRAKCRNLAVPSVCVISSLPLYGPPIDFYATALFAVANTKINTLLKMAEEHQESTGLQHAVKRLSSLLKRTRSSKRNSTCNRPNKDATPSRSALKGGRWPGLPEERRVSFHDSLPCLRLGPPFEYQPSSDAVQHDRRTGLLLPAITADDRDTDDCFRQVDYSPKRVDSSLDDSVVPKPVARRDGVAGPATLHRTTTVRFPRAGSEGIPDRAQRRRSCLNFTSAMMEERSRSQSRMRPRPLFAERNAVDRSSWPSISVRQHSPVSPAADSYLLYLEHEPRTRDDDGLNEPFSTYQSHVDRSILSMQRQDKRHSWYLLDSLVQMQGALDQTIMDTPLPRPRPVSADIRELLRALETGNNGTSEDETQATSSKDSPGDLAQRSASTCTSANTTHEEPSVRPVNLIVSSEASPPLIPTRHPERPSDIALGKRRAITATEHAEDKDVLNDSGISINM
jgi:hypothetical protein